MSKLYDDPKYYELAFSYRDIAAEVAVFDALIARFSGTAVRRVLEIACGHAPHLAEVTRRGRQYVGLDINPSMLERARERARACDAHATFVESSLIDFKLARPADFAFVALASLYVKSTAELRSHFRAMADALVPGALYVLEWCVDFDPMVDVVDSWTVERDGIAVQGSFWSRSLNRVEQLYEDTLRLDINDNGRRFTLEDKSLRRRIFPQEFLAYVRDHTAFEFVGWWHNWDLECPVTGEHAVDRPIIVVRRR